MLDRLDHRREFLALPVDAVGMVVQPDMADLVAQHSGELGLVRHQ